MDVKEVISSGIAELYVLGMASEAEKQLVEKLAAEHPEMQKELEEIRASLDAYGSSFSQTPDPALKAKIEEQFQAYQIAAEQTVPVEKKEEAVVYRMSSLAKYTVAASIMLLAGSLTLNYIFYNKYNKTSNELASAKAQVEEQLAINDEMKQDMQIISSKYSQAVSLGGTERFPEAAAKVYWLKNTGEVYIDPSSLPQAPSGKQYQLWALIDGKPFDAGVIEKGDKKLHIQKMKSFGRVNAFAITLEKEGGSPTPDLEQMYVIGNL